MQRIGFLLLAEEMLRRSGARGIEVWFTDEENQEVKVRIEVSDSQLMEKKNEKVGKKRKM
ncbi:MAG: hypothetical protein J5662_02125 [Clostridia bacterium]|nr:hypothetical protein [Clostridia bacterium]